MADIRDNAQPVEGASSHGTAVGENPLLSGGEARTTLPTAVSDGQNVRAMYDDLGRQVVAPYSARDRIVHNTIELTTTTETTLIAAGGAGVFRDLVGLIVGNDSATLVTVLIRDATAGTIRHRQPVAASGGGAVIKFPAPLTQAVANNNWTATLEAAVTSVFLTAVAIENN